MTRTPFLYKFVRGLFQKLSLLFICLFISNFIAAQWIKKANAIKKRSEVASVIYNNKLYAFLGFKDSLLNVESSVEVYDPTTNTWKLLNSLPLNKSVTHEGIVMVDDKVWCIGGRVGKNPGPLTSEIWIYDITKNSWSAGPKIIAPATGNQLLWGAGGAALLGRTLHVFGGFIINACNNDQDKYHLTLNVDEWAANPKQPGFWKNDLAPLPIKRNHFGTVVLGGKIYVIGGQFGHDCKGGLDRQYSHVYDPSSNIWTELPTLIYPRSHIEGSVFAIDGKIYVVAGQGASGANSNKVLIFNPSANNGIGSWSENSTLQLPKNYEGLSAKVINNLFIYSHGGQGSSRNTQNATFSRSITRYPVYKLGFTSGCINLNDSSGKSLKGNTWLFTIDGTKAYTTFSDATWLSVSKNATGLASSNAIDIEISANPDGLSAGTYTGTITATGNAGGITYTAASLCVTLTINPKQKPIYYSLNTNTNGFGQVSKYPDSSSYLKGSSVTLIALPDEGYEFAGWNGQLESAENPLHLIMDTSIVINANFSLIPPATIALRKSDTADTSFLIIKSLSIGQKNCSSQLRVFPNPSPAKKVFIEGKNLMSNKNVNLNIYNAFGSIILSTIIITDASGSFQRKISLPNYIAKGMYIVKANIMSESLEKSFIVY